MIPLRIYAKGFMCFRDSVEMDFDGASLWMLTGNNGAGKSAIFDVMTYALYGIHRKGKQEAQFLINKQSPGLDVQFDFAVGADWFRVKRTLGRKGKPTYQAFECKGWRHNQSSKLQPVSGTEQEKGFNAWVEQIVGLDATAFTSSVLLEQGKSDALLTAEPKKRHQVLSQIVDLSRYERLYELADTRRRDNDGQTKALLSQYDSIAPVDETALDSLAQQIVSATTACEESDTTRKAGGLMSGVA